MIDMREPSQSCPYIDRIKDDLDTAWKTLEQIVDDPDCDEGLENTLREVMRHIEHDDLLEDIRNVASTLRDQRQVYLNECEKLENEVGRLENDIAMMETSQ